MRRLFVLLLSVVSLCALAQTDSLQQQIALDLERVEANLPQINLILKQGEKIQARQMVNDALKQITEIEANQQKLAQLDKTANEETLLIAKTRETKQYLIDKANKLRNAIHIYMVCNAKLIDAEYEAFCKELQGELSQLGVTFVNSANDADWKITVKASARPYNQITNGSYFTYAEAQLTIEKANGKRVYEDAISEKGGHTRSYEHAAREAYKSLVPRIDAIIKEQIEK